MEIRDGTKGSSCQLVQGYTSHCIRGCALKLPVYCCEADTGQVTGTSNGMRHGRAAASESLVASGKPNHQSTKVIQRASINLRKSFFSFNFFNF